jgi:apolipoprotein D and lipocalin family protein
MQHEERSAMNRKVSMYPLGLLVAGICLLGCVGAPEGVEPVQDFEVERYLGRWYEVARLDHSFERGLQAVAADYSMREDGGVRVVNSGVSERNGEASQAEGKAYFVGQTDVAHLKVSFFGPFYGAYVVFELDDNYQYAFVAGNSTKYLWLLARAPSVSDGVMARFLERAAELGFNTDDLIFVKHPPG